MGQKRLSRRTVLRGIGQTMVALPFLEIFLNESGTAFADESPFPKGFILTYNGLSVNKTKTREGVKNLYVPVRLGNGYDLPPALEPLGAANVGSDVSVISNLEIPWGKGNRTQPGSIDEGAHHTYAHWPLLTGKKKMGNSGHISADELLYDFLGRKGKQLRYYVESERYPYGALQSLSLRDSRYIFGERSLEKAYTSLFTNFTAPTNLAEQKEKLRQIDRKKSVLDLVKADFQSFKKRLGQSDLIQIDEHFSKIREIEGQMASIRREVASSEAKSVSCSKYPLPNSNFPKQTNYSGEIQRAPLWADLLKMAFACQLSQVATLMITHCRSGMLAKPFTGIQSPDTGDFHSSSHGNASYKNYEPLARWQTKVYADLVSKLKSVRVGSQTLLDSTVVLHLIEAGFGHSVEDPTDAYSPHSCESMVVMISGNKDAGLKQGLHIDGRREHPVKVINTALHSMGMKNPQLGEVKGLLPGLIA